MHQNVPELTMASIALNLDAPDAPPMLPSDPDEALENSRAYVARCLIGLERAETALDREIAELFYWNARNELQRWQAALERKGRML